jgi:hypothetical protein
LSSAQAAELKSNIEKVRAWWARTHVARTHTNICTHNILHQIFCRVYLTKYSV